MPIYAYRCTSCGHAKDVLQKLSDPLLRVCPVCGESSFAKQLTAAGFQLKGSGWYVTDFRNTDNKKEKGNGKPADAEDGAKPAAGDVAKPAEPAKPAEAATAASSTGSSAASTPASGGDA